LLALSNIYLPQRKLVEARVALEESLSLARELGDLSRELFALNTLGRVALEQGDLTEAERLFNEVYRRAITAGDRERTMVVLNDLSIVVDERGDLELTQEYGRQVLALAREIGAQDMVALGLINQADGDIKLGELLLARAELCEGLALARRIGAAPSVVGAVLYFGKLAYAEGQTDRALALLGLARNHPVWNSIMQRDLDITLGRWALEPSLVQEGMAKGTTLDWDKTIEELQQKMGGE
jgi:tetratricopeptide (TPR) repeat protein